MEVCFPILKPFDNCNGVRFVFPLYNPLIAMFEIEGVAHLLTFYFSLNTWFYIEGAGFLHLIEC